MGGDGAGDGAVGRRGTTQTGVRVYHERLALSLIRTHGNLAKAEIARLSGLSAQTVSVIVRQLEADNLVLKGVSIKGRVGQPSQPYSLNPDGAFSIGLKVGGGRWTSLLSIWAARCVSRCTCPITFHRRRRFLALPARVLMS